MPPPIGTLQALPHNGKPITDWANRTKAFQDVIRGITLVITPFLEKFLKEQIHLLLSLNRNEEALALIEQAISNNPTKAAYYRIKGSIIDWDLPNPNFEQALHAYNEAIRLDPYDPLSYTGKSYALVMLDRGEEAVSAMDNAIHLDPHNHIYLSNRDAIVHMFGLAELEEVE